MVPSRSRKTAGRKALGSGKALTPHARAFEAIAGPKQNLRRRKDAFDRNARHATMVDGTFAQKAWTALHRFANQRELRGHGPGAFGIRGTEYADHRDTYRPRHVHRPRIIADKQTTGGEQRRKFADGCRANEIEYAIAHRAGDARGHAALLSSAAKYHVCIKRADQPVGKLRVAFRIPALGGTISRAGGEGDAYRISPHPRGKKTLQRFLPVLLGDCDADLIDSGQAREPAGAAKQFEIVVGFVCRSLTFCRKGNGFGQ